MAWQQEAGAGGWLITTLISTREVERVSRKWSEPALDVLPPERFHFLKVPYPPQTAPPTKDQTFNYVSL